MLYRASLACVCIALGALAALSGCKSDSSSSKVPAPTVAVDKALAPTVDPLPGPENTTRPVAAVTDSSGLVANFVEQELILVTDSDAELQAFVQRWKGKVVQTIDPNAAVDGKSAAVRVELPKIHHVRIDASLADRNRLGPALQKLDDKARGAHRVSSELGLGTLAAAAQEAAAGLKVGVNFVMQGSGYGDGQLADAPNGPSDFGPYTPNANDWTYMKQGGTHDIGVTEAWRKLDAVGKLKPGRIAIAVLDGGFREFHTDYPAGRLFLSAVPWYPDPKGMKNTMGCGGSPCPWHGMAVALAAAGVPDNGIAGAGPAGPVASLNMIMVIGDMFTGVQAVTVAAAIGSKVINMSYGVPIPAAFAFSNGPFELTTKAVRKAGVLLFASAGNAGEDVDKQDCFIVCWEGTFHSPCENEGVHCVGGVEPRSTSRYTDSNYGRDDQTSGTVDLAGPFGVYGIGAVADPATGSDPIEVSPTTARWFWGTSASSPFVAGVAALTWAADPSRSADAVEEILFETARPIGGGLKKLVNAANAMTRALAETPGNDGGCPMCVSPDAALRWDGSTGADAGPRADGATKDAGPKDGAVSDGPACNIVGTWKGTVPAGPFAGQSNTWELKANGTTVSKIGSTTINGTWTLSGSTLTVTDVSATPASAACAAGDSGTYAVVFSADCKTMTLTAIADPCAGREAVLDAFKPGRVLFAQAPAAPRWLAATGARSAATARG